ncbi:MAG: GNAT family N-acetyltransferase [Gemmatimonadota bacterium]
MNDDILIRPLHGYPEYEAAVALEEETWGRGFRDRVPPSILMVAQELGGVASGAWRGERLVGFVFGMTGLREGRLVHWSDMLAVRPDERDRGLGRSLKLHQRDRLLTLGVHTVHWTFEPLESRNAYLNFARLGAKCREYRRDLYGVADSPLHRGLGTDRLVVDWAIASERVQHRLEGDERPPGPEDVAGLPVVNPTFGEADVLACEEPDLGLDAERVRVAIPVDIQGLKERAPELVLDWRARVRSALEGYLARGYVVTELVREGSRSCYVLARGGLAR